MPVTQTEYRALCATPSLCIIWETFVRLSIKRMLILFPCQLISLLINYFSLLRKLDSTYLIVYV